MRQSKRTFFVLWPCLLGIASSLSAVTHCLPGITSCLPAITSCLPAITSCSPAATTCLPPSSQFTNVENASSSASKQVEGREELEERFATELESLAAECEQDRLTEVAAAIRQWQIPRDPQRLYIFIPTSGDAFELAAEYEDQIWYERFREIRRRQAAGLFELAVQALDSGDSAKSVMLLYELLREDPDHELARKVLGFERRDAGWTRGHEHFVSSRSRRAHPTYPWRAREHWRINTDHFTISTSHSLEGGEQLGRSLERLFSVWEQVFFEYWGSDEMLERRFQIENLSTPFRRQSWSRRVQVILFKDRAEYLQVLSQVVPGAARTYGYYAPEREEALFYFEESELENTWFHESTHQLFQELVPAIKDAGNLNNVWVLEGIATFMESLEDHGDYLTLGGFDASWLQYARFRAVGQDIYFPLAELCAVSKSELQSHPQIQMIYSQSAGLSHYFMTGTDDRSRQAFIDYIASVYKEGRGRVDALSQLTGRRFEEIDTSYRQFLSVNKLDLEQHLLRPQDVRQLVLIRSNVNDDSLEILKQAGQLEWLDLTATPITNETVQHLVNCNRLTQLFVAGTRIDDQGLEEISKLTSIVELDLMQTRVTGEGIRYLSAMPNLESVRLSYTNVDDSCIEHLARIDALLSVDFKNSRVTEEGRLRLRELRPNLVIDGE